MPVPYPELKSIFPQVHGDQHPIQTFAWTSDMKAVIPVAPYYEEVFYPDAFSQLKHIYELLYPERNFSQIAIPVSYHKFGRLKLAGDIVGSEMPGVNSKQSAVVIHKGI